MNRINFKIFKPIFTKEKFINNKKKYIELKSPKINITHFNNFNKIITRNHHTKKTSNINFNPNNPKNFFTILIYLCSCYLIVKINK